MTKLKNKIIIKYLDIWCEVLEDKNGSYLLLIQSTNKYKQPENYLNKSYNYGFKEIFSNKYCLQVLFANDSFVIHKRPAYTVLIHNNIEYHLTSHGYEPMTYISDENDNRILYLHNAYDLSDIEDYFYFGKNIVKTIEVSKLKSINRMKLIDIFNDN